MTNMLYAKELEDAMLENKPPNMENKVWKKLDHRELDLIRIPSQWMWLHMSLMRPQPLDSSKDCLTCLKITRVPTRFTFYDDYFNFK